MLTMPSSQRKHCGCNVQRPRLSLNLSKAQSIAKPVQVYANGEPMDLSCDLRGSSGILQNNRDNQGPRLKKWDSFEVLENLCERSLQFDGENCDDNTGKYRVVVGRYNNSLCSSHFHLLVTVHHLFGSTSNLVYVDLVLLRVFSE